MQKHHYLPSVRWLFVDGPRAGTFSSLNYQFVAESNFAFVVRRCGQKTELEVLKCRAIMFEESDVCRIMREMFPSMEVATRVDNILPLVVLSDEHDRINFELLLSMYPASEDERMGVSGA